MADPSANILHCHGRNGTVDVKVVNNVAVMTMKCGENRFNKVTIAKIHAALDLVEGNPDAQVLVSTSEGKFYSTGLDLPWLTHLIETNKEAELKEFFKSFMDLMIRILLFPLPTIALINGHAAAGGAILALGHDIRIMRKDRGFFYLSEVRIGITFRHITHNIVCEKIPNGAAFTEAVILGKRLTGTDTQRLGISSFICDQAELGETAFRVARELLAQGPLNRKSLSNHKRNMYSKIVKTCVDGHLPHQAFDFAGALKLSKM